MSMAASRALEEIRPLLLEEDGEEEDGKQNFISNRSALRPHFRSNNFDQDFTNEFQKDGARLNTVAVFVVTFDTVSGHMIEWCQPTDINLSGIEYKSMPSGSHTVMTDFAYFRFNKYYGLSAFKRMSVCSEVERGARMKSVGLLSTSFFPLHRCLPFLEKQVDAHLHSPGDYRQLEDFYEQSKGVLHGDGDDVRQLPSQLPRYMSKHTDPLQDPASAVMNFVKYFGANVFVLWKLVLLRKRILFYSPPPIGAVCYRVQCCCMLSASCQHSTSPLEVPQNPLFYINLADIPTLESEHVYVGCTTERVFEDKTRLHDVFINNQTIFAPGLPDAILRPTPNDINKFRSLQVELGLADVNGRGSSISSGESAARFIRYFSGENERVGEMLSVAVDSLDACLTSAHLVAAGLDPYEDGEFVGHLVRTHGYDITLTLDEPACCSWSYWQTLCSSTSQT